MKNWKHFSCLEWIFWYFLRGFWSAIVWRCRERFINHQRREGTGPCHEMNLPATRSICSEIQVSKWNVFLILTDIFFYVLILSPSIRNKSTLRLIFINFDFCCELIFCISLLWSPKSYRLALNEFSVVNCVGSLILRNIREKFLLFRRIY